MAPDVVDATPSSVTWRGTAASEARRGQGRQINHPKEVALVKTAMRLGAIAPLAALVVLGFPSPARAVHVGCGTVITTDTVLDSDVGPCATDGIIVGASGITLDLNGHTVSGTPGSANDGAGVLVEEQSEVTVKNGTVQLFDAGVVIRKGANNTVSAVTARDNVGNASLSDYGDGIALVSTHNNEVRGNTVERNGPFSGISVFQQGSFAEADPESPGSFHGGGSGGGANRNLIDGNTVRDNSVRRCFGTRCVNDDIGIRLEPGTKQNTVTNNTVTGSGLEGIRVFSDSDYNIVNGNTVTGNGFNAETHRKGDGIRLDGSSHHGGGADNNILLSNTVNDNAVHGIVLGPLSRFNEIRLNTALNNNVTMNAHGYDLEDGNGDSAVGGGGISPCDDNVWADNVYGTRNQSCVS